LLVSKFQQIAMSRQAQAMAARRDFWLYIDEFDEFITPTMAEILKGARKYRLGLTLAHQELHQLQSDPKVASAVARYSRPRIDRRTLGADHRSAAKKWRWGHQGCERENS
jgi:type IV secretory pathway TraG/TraD family ATPase VirD4